MAPHDEAPLEGTEVAHPSESKPPTAERAPIARFRGRRAEEAFLRARLAEARESGDAEGERRAAEGLARRLVARGASPMLAIELAERALLLDENPRLREELVGWLVAAGEPRRAAEALRPLVPFDNPRKAARLLLRIGVLLARGDDVPGALAAFDEAARLDPENLEAPEFAGTLASADEGKLARERGAKAFIEAYERAEEGEARRLSLLRAFELLPESSEVAEALAKTLRGEGREAGAELVERAHLRASFRMGGDTKALERIKLAAGDLALSLEIALDAKLDFAADGPEAERFDDLLARMGLHEIFATRLENRAACAEPARRPGLYADLSRLYAGPLANPERAIETWLAALSANPDNEEALRALRAHAAVTRDDSALLEGLLRASTSEKESEGREVWLRELASLAEERFQNPALALFALEKLGPEEAAAAKSRLLAQKEARDEVIQAARAELQGREGGARVGPLQQLASLLRGDPSERESLAQVLGELVALSPEDSRAALDLERLVARTKHLGWLAPLYRGEAGEERARLLSMRVARDEGDFRGALAAIEPLLASRKSLEAASHALFLAARLSDESKRAEALDALAAFAQTELQPIWLLAAADAWSRAGNFEKAREAVEAALRLEPNSPRALSLLADLDREAGDPRGAWTIPRSFETLPKSENYRAMARMAAEAGDLALALLWTQPWLALRPGDPDALAETIRLALATKDEARLDKALSLALERPLPRTTTAALLANFIEVAYRQSPARGLSMARRAIEELGPVEPARRAVLAVAEEAGDKAFLAAILEGALALDGAVGEESHRAELRLALLDARLALGDQAGALRVVSDALRESDLPPEEALSRLPKRLPESPDAVFTYLEIEAEALLLLGPARLDDAGAALRRLGGARWDLAEDREGAVAAWIRAEGLLERPRGEGIASDLMQFTDADAALRLLESFASAADDAQAQAISLMAAAKIALDQGENERAAQLADDALLTARDGTEALSLLEKASEAAEDFDTLDAAYHRLARAERDAGLRHSMRIRAARHLDRAGRSSLALNHLVDAFEASPADETTLSLLVEVAVKASAEPRIANLLEATLPKLSEPSALANAVSIARAALTDLGDIPLAHAAISRALEAKGAVPELSSLLPHAEALAEEGELARGWIERVLSLIESGRIKARDSAFRLASAVAERLEDQAAFASFLVAAGRDAPPAGRSKVPTLIPETLAHSPPSPAPMRPAAPSFELSSSRPPSPPAVVEPKAWTIPPLLSSTSPSEPPSSSPPLTDSTDTELLDALKAGSLEAGDLLAQRIEQAEQKRPGDLLIVRQFQANLLPGDRERLRQLRDAAAEARESSRARAVEHVLRCFDPAAGRLSAPSLASQDEQAEAASNLIFRSPPDAGLEALAIVCEGAPQLFRRDLMAYGYSGAQRIPLGSRAPAGRIYTLLARLLGLTQIPLFHSPSSRKLSWTIALLAPPAVLLSGDAQEENAELRYEIGAAMASAMPAHALLAALPRDRAETVLAAVLAAYGPAGQMPRSPAIVAIAETLWQLLPARIERQLREVCNHAGAAGLDYENILTRQKRLVRRAGLFASGDLELSILRYFEENKLSPSLLDQPEGLANVCAAHPEVAELVRLAMHPAYAKARWQLAGASAPSSGISSSGFRSEI